MFNYTVLTNIVNRTKTYVSPSDNIMSPCTAKITALRNKHASKSVTTSLYAQSHDPIANPVVFLQSKAQVTLRPGER